MGCILPFVRIITLRQRLAQHPKGRVFPVKSRIRTASLALLIALCFSFSCTAAAADEVHAASFDTFFETYNTVFDDDVAELLNGQSAKLLQKLSEKLQDFEPGQLAEDLAALLKVSAEMTDEELSAAIGDAAQSRGVTLKDSQVQQLVDLCRSLEKLDSDELKAKINGLRSFTENLEETKGFFAGLFSALRELFARIGEMFSRLFSSLL